FTVFFLVFKHILSSLISLEFIALAIFSIFRLSPILLKSEMYSSFLFISIVVCEAALGFIDPNLHINPRLRKST
ncbi:hypothetical protein Avbf_05499, partial [Armadillidium vulgare]